MHPPPSLEKFIGPIVVFGVIVIGPWLYLAFVFVNFWSSYSNLRRRLKEKYPEEYEKLPKLWNFSYVLNLYTLDPAKAVKRGIGAYGDLWNFSKSEDHPEDLELNQLRKNLSRSFRKTFLLLFIILAFDIFILPLVAAFLFPFLLN